MSIDEIARVEFGYPDLRQNAKQWIEVSIDEIEQMIENARNDGGIYNGCTIVELCKKYGEENVKHVRGEGYYKLV